jgi:hypothetical protein
MMIAFFLAALLIDKLESGVGVLDGLLDLGLPTAGVGLLVLGLLRRSDSQT